LRLGEERFLVFEGDDFLYLVNFFHNLKIENPYKYIGIVAKCLFVIVWIKKERVNFFYAGFIDRDFWD